MVLWLVLLWDLCYDNPSYIQLSDFQWKSDFHWTSGWLQRRVEEEESVKQVEKHGRRRRRSWPKWRTDFRWSKWLWIGHGNQPAQRKSLSRIVITRTAVEGRKRWKGEAYRRMLMSWWKRLHYFYDFSALCSLSHILTPPFGTHWCCEKALSLQW